LANRPDSQTVMSQLKTWFDDYNSYHPHSALGYLPKQMFQEKRAANKTAGGTELQGQLQFNLATLSKTPMMNGSIIQCSMNGCHNIIGPTWQRLQDFATKWMWSYNHDRPTMALGGFTPKQRLAMAA
jgi:transposase InsO family protein